MSALGPTEAVTAEAAEEAAPATEETVDDEFPDAADADMMLLRELLTIICPELTPVAELE